MWWSMTSSRCTSPKARRRSFGSWLASPGDSLSVEEVSPMIAACVVEVVRELERGGVVVWVDGGWGIDALLGRETRPHADLDLVIDRDQLPRARLLLGGLGFEDVPDAQL